MAITFAKTPYAGKVEVFWRGDAKMLPGGFKLISTQNIALGTTVLRGTPVYVDFNTHTAAICKTAKVVNGGTTSAPCVAKGHYFAVGDKVTVNGGTGTGTIASVDTSNADYDVLTFGSAVTGATADAVLVEGTTAGTAQYTPNNVVGADHTFDGKGIDALDVAYDALVLIKHLAFPVLASWLEGGYCLKANHAIKFITQ